MRNTARCMRGPRAARFQWSRLASSTTSGVRSSDSISQEQVYGSAVMMTLRVRMDEAPWTRVNGPVPQGPGSSITHQWPSPEPNFL